MKSYLAQLRSGIAVIAGLVLFGCSDGEQREYLGPPDLTPRAQLARVILTPQIGTLEIDEPLQLQVFGRSTNGDSVGVVADWSASGGVISDQGVFVASGPGTYRVVARARGQADKADSATVAVLPGTNEIDNVRVAPGFVSVEPAGVVQFSAVTTFRDGSTGTGPVFWIASAGSINSAGLYVAPDFNGDFQVIAATSNGRADTARVLVRQKPVLSQLTISPQSATLESGDDQQMHAEAVWSDGSTAVPVLDWSTDGGTIDETGLFTAGSLTGDFEIRATRRGGTQVAVAAVRVPEARVVGLTVTPSLVQLAPGAVQRFTAEALLSNGSSRSANVTWQATGGSITGSGHFTAGTTSGSYRVIATITGGTLRDTASVTIANPSATLTSLDITPASAVLGAGQTRQFNVAASWSDGSTNLPPIAWTATGGTVSTGGAYVAGSVPGSYRVIASHQGGTKADTAAVTITAPALTQLILSPVSVTVVPNGTATFSVSGVWSDGSTAVPAVTYSASGGTINSAGAYTAGGTTGTYQVVALHQASGLADTSLVTISSPAAFLRSLDIVPDNVTLSVRAIQYFGVSAQWSDGSTTPPAITWSASAGSITSAGRYTAPEGVGTYRVIARHQGGTLADTAVVTVIGSAPVLTGIVVSPATASVQPSGTRQFSVTGVWTNGGSGAPAVNWSATGGAVSASGLFTAGSVPGTYRVIAVQSGGTLADTSVVTVSSATPQLTAITVSPGTASVGVGAGQQFTVAGTWTNGGTGVPAVSWSATGGTISSTGAYVAGQTVGTYRVIARELGGTLADTADVTVTSQSPQLIAIAVAPKPATMSTGTVQQFTVTGTWTNGGTSTPSVNWTATGGTVTSNGRYTAGSTPGTYRVVATQQGGTISDTAVVTLITPVLTALAIAPDPATVPGGANQQFAVTGTWSDGVSRPVPVTYSATGGTVSTSGLYTAGQVVGAFMVAAACGCGPSDTAAVNVTAPSSPTLTAINLTPATVSVVTGASQQFAVTAVWTGGTGTLPTIVYSATGGTINSSGVYQAGSTAGNYRVIAQVQGGTLADTSAVTVTAVPPPPPVSGPLANQPSGLTQMTLQNWLTKVPTGGLTPGVWTQDGQSAASTTSPFTPPGSGWDPNIKSLQIRFPSGHPGGTAPDQTFYKFAAGADKQEIYLHYQLQFGNFLNPNVQTKHVWVGRTGDQGSGFFFQFKKSGSYAPNNDQGSSEDAYLSMNSQGLPNSNRVLSANQGWTINLNNGTRATHRVEIYIKAASARAVADGIVKVWINGRLFMSYTDVDFFGAAWPNPLTFDRIEIEHTYGGGSTPVPIGTVYDITLGPVYLSGR